VTLILDLDLVVLKMYLPSIIGKGFQKNRTCTHTDASEYIDMPD